MVDKCKDGVCENEVDYLHECPFQADINENDEDYCRCCDSCRADCSEEI